MGIFAGLTMKIKGIAIRFVSFLLLMFLLCQAGAKATVFFKTSSKVAKTAAAKKVKNEAQQIVTSASVEAVVPFAGINIDPFLYIVYKFDLLPQLKVEEFTAPVVALLPGVKILYRSLICRNAP